MLPSGDVLAAVRDLAWCQSKAMATRDAFGVRGWTWPPAFPEWALYETLTDGG